MNRREFRKTINSLRARDRRSLDPGKVEDLEDERKEALVRFIVRHRGPILTSLLTSSTDRGWLAACGYLTTTTGAESGLTFLHTSETEIR